MLLLSAPVATSAADVGSQPFFAAYTPPKSVLRLGQRCPQPVLKDLGWACLVSEQADDVYERCYGGTTCIMAQIAARATAANRAPKESQ